MAFKFFQINFMLDRVQGGMKHEFLFMCSWKRPKAMHEIDLKKLK